MKKIIKKTVKNILKIFNLKLSYHTKTKRRYSKIIDAYHINVVFDIGANMGQFGLALLYDNFNGKIISFEPTRDAHFKLEKLSRKYPNWLTHERVAIGERNGIVKINVAGNSAESSSILNMGSVHKESAPDSQYIGNEDVKLITLDSVFNDYARTNDEVMIKIDAQGYEEQVLTGAIDSIKKVRAIKLECSLVSLYEGDKTYKFYFDWLEKLGFILFDLEAGHAHPITGRLLQFDAVFVRE